MKKAIEIIDVNGCIVRDERGVPLARLEEDFGVVIIKKMPACSLGMFFYIVDYLKELGFDVRG